MLQLSQDDQHRYQVLLKRIEEYRLGRIGHGQQLEELDTQARVAQSEFNALHNSFAPIAALSDDVLTMVFEAATSLKQETKLHFAIRVSHVTRRWRNIALAAPRLWATIWCVKSKGMERKPYPETMKERTAAFLTRSRSLLVEIHIRHSFAANDQQLLQLIGNHLGRCQHFSMAAAGFERRELSPVLMHFLRHSAPRLESFAFGPAKNRKALLQLDEPLFPSGVPHLITAQFGMFDFNTFHFCLPAFQSVTSLRLTSIYIDHRHDDYASYASFRAGLMALPSLTHLELQEDYVQVNLPCLPVVLPALQVLHVSCTPRGHGILRFLGSFIRGASLTVLVLQGCFYIDDVPEALFPSLQHLILLEVPSRTPGFDILSRFPSIQQLTCQASTVFMPEVGIADVFAALCQGLINAGHRMPCPQLHIIAVSAAYRTLDVVALIAQLSTLQDKGVPIRKLMLPTKLFAQLRVDAEVVAQLKAVVEVEDFQVDWPTPFASERFTDLKI